MGKRKPKGIGNAGQKNKISNLLENPRPVDQVILWLVEGKRTPDIVDSIVARYPDEQPAALLASALEYFASISNPDVPTIRGWCFEAYRELYRRMVDVGDYKGAIAAIKELRKECS